MIGCRAESVLLKHERALRERSLRGKQAFQDGAKAIGLAEPDVAKHREDEDEADEDIDPMLGQHERCPVGADDLKRKQAREGE